VSAFVFAAPVPVCVLRRWAFHKSLHATVFVRPHTLPLIPTTPHLAHNRCCPIVRDFVQAGCACDGPFLAIASFGGWNGEKLAQGEGDGKEERAGLRGVLIVQRGSNSARSPTHIPALPLIPHCSRAHNPVDAVRQRAERRDLLADLPAAGAPAKVRSCGARAGRRGRTSQTPAALHRGPSAHGVSFLSSSPAFTCPMVLSES
jgi:hypothetical protein